MRKNFTIVLGLLSFCAAAQDTLKTTTLNEVVVTGTKFEVPVEKSGKTIFKINQQDIERNAGKTLSDLLNEVPGIQMDGNFSSPANNQSYYVRGGRNKNTLILIDGVPLNDPSGINAEYDLRFIPLSQIASIEVLKGGLSTLYGTGAAAGVINITLKHPTDKLSGAIEATAGSFGTYSQNLQVSGSANKLTYLVSGGNYSSVGFSSAQDNNDTLTFDKDGIQRQNVLVKLGYELTKRFFLGVQSAYETFDADYDNYEFTDANYHQRFEQVRIGFTPKFSYEKGDIEGRIFINRNRRDFMSDYPSSFKGNNFQGEIVHRHRFSNTVQTLSGLNVQHLAFEQESAISSDTANFTMIDPYVSLLVDHPSGLALHAGVRLNNHSVYGSKLVYNINPSFLVNQNGDFQYKLYASASTSYITPSLYQIYSFYGNHNLKPETSFNLEAGWTLYHQRGSMNAVLFSRDEQQPIDFQSLFDTDGNYIGGQYKNLVAKRNVSGVELNGNIVISSLLSLSAQGAWMKTDVPTSFYKIPKSKYGAAATVQPSKDLLVSLKYNFTGKRTTMDYSTYTEVKLARYQLVDVFASYKLMRDKISVYGSINNVFNQHFVAIYGYTTKGRNFNAGVRYTF